MLIDSLTLKAVAKVYDEFTEYNHSMFQKNSQYESFSDRLLKDHIIVIGITTAILLVAAQWIVFAIYFFRIPPEIPLYYSLMIGEEQLASSVELITLPIAAMVSCIVWCLIFYTQKALKPFFHQLSLWLTNIVIFLSAIALLHIIIIIY